MAVRAAAVEVLDGAERLGLRGVPAAVVAGIANTRHANFQQLRIIRPMGLMAVRAVFHHRRMFPEKRPTPLRMATQAVFVRCALDELLGIGRAMRIVAARASHFAFPIRHVRRPLQLRSTHLMALQA